MAQRGDQVLIGLDMNSSRARAVCGPPDRAPGPLFLDGEHDTLPLALSLEGRYPEVGRPGLALCRRSPHLACSNFLAHLETPRQWVTDRHRLDAGQALALVLGRLQPACAGKGGLVLAVPAYLSLGQVQVLAAAAHRARLPVLGSVAAPLASAVAAYAEHPWQGAAVLVDVDDHALTLLTVRAVHEQAQLQGARILPQLNLRVWKDRLLAAVADRCVRQSRRDPRDSAPAEQALYDQLEDLLDACREGRRSELAVRSAHWYQNLILQPEEPVQFCTLLTRAVVDALEGVRMAAKPDVVPQAVFLTASAGRLPGVAAALQECLHDLSEQPAPAEGGGDQPWPAVYHPPQVAVLPVDAAARAAHALAVQFLHRELPPGHLDLRVPLPPAEPLEAGPPRLHFSGRDYPLNRSSFTLGRQPACDLAFDSQAYPAVSGWHCEVVSENRRYVLHDRSRFGTLVNGQPVARQMTLAPGDWIQLGPDGPVLRFLGQAAGPRKVITA
jgi:hypothetical protein